jgi:hypothetical protein
MCRSAAAVVAVSFPTMAGHLLEAYDSLSDIDSWKKSAGDEALSPRAMLSAFTGVYHCLRLLSLAAATRLGLKDPYVTSDKLAQDHYRKEFEARYDRFRIARTAAIFSEPIQ